MKLLTDELRARLPPLYSQEAEAEPMVYARFVLPGTAPDQLTVDPRALMIFRQNDMQAAAFGNTGGQANIGAPTSHVGRHGDPSALSGAGHDLRLVMILAGVQHCVNQPTRGQDLANCPRRLDRPGADQDRPTGDTDARRRVGHHPPARIAVGEHLAAQAPALNRTIGRDPHDLHTIDRPELRRVFRGSSRHAR